MSTASSISLSERLVIRQHVRVSLTRIVDTATIRVAITELAVARLTEFSALTVSLVTIGVDHGMVGLGGQQLVLALPTHGLLFLK